MIKNLGSNQHHFLKLLTLNFPPENHKVTGTYEEFLNQMGLLSMQYFFENSVKIKVSEKIVNTLLHTDSDGNFLHLPFPAIFLDCVIEDENYLMKGILLYDDYQILNDKNKKDNLKSVDDLQDFEYNPKSKQYLTNNRDNFILKNLREVIASRIEERKKRGNDKKFHSVGFVLIAKKGDKDNLIIISDIKNVIEIQHLEKNSASFELTMFFRKISGFIDSFLNFLYFPEVELVKEKTNRDVVIHNKTGLNIKNYYISVTGKVRRYVESFHDGFLRNKHVLSWTVRGYIRTYINEKYKNVKGQKQFIAPFNKGIGAVSKKDYYVKDKSETSWLSEQKLADIVQNIFPDQLIFRNNRSVLDGLEIDVYLPTLKLGFEFNGKQHYNFIPIFHKKFADFQNTILRDKVKNKRAVEKGVMLITIKYDCELTEDNIRQLIDSFCELC